jgi:hypothetical protein
MRGTRVATNGKQTWWEEQREVSGEKLEGSSVENLREFATTKT